MKLFNVYLQESSKTHHLTTETYDDFISSHENVLIFFHALYASEYCAPMMPEWDLAAAQLAEDEGKWFPFQSFFVENHMQK